MISTPPGLIVFDLDGVLVDTTPCHEHAFAELWARIGIRGPDYASIAGRTTAEVVAEVTAPLGPSDAERAGWVRFKQERARTLVAEQSAPFPDSAPTLRDLHRQGRRLALGTGASSATAGLVLRHAGLEGFFPVVVTGDDIHRGKPDPETYRLVLARCGTEAEAALVVEDSEAGIAAGLAAGARVVSVRSGLRDGHPRFLEALPDLAALTGFLAACGAS